jgi:hypothetical protein
MTGSDFEHDASVVIGGANLLRSAAASGSILLKMIVWGNLRDVAWFGDPISANSPPAAIAIFDRRRA